MTLNLKFYNYIYKIKHVHRNSSEDELRHLRENKGDVQRVPAAIQSAQFKTCPSNHTQNRNQNYENFIEKIAETRSRAQLKTNLLKVFFYFSKTIINYLNVIIINFTKSIFNLFIEF